MTVLAMDAFRGLMSAFPTGVAVITSVDERGRPHGMTCTSLSSVTLDPPTLLLCLDIRSGTLAALRASGSVAVNLLHSRGRQAAEIFASRSAARFDHVAWQPTELTGMPGLVNDAFAVAECKVRDLTAVGDHMIVLAEVLSVDQRADVPLLYGLRQFCTWPVDGRPDPPGG